MYINHLTLTTGTLRRSPREEVSEASVEAMFPWTLDALASRGAPYPLLGELSKYSAVLLTNAGALVVTVFGEAPEVGRGLPLVTFGVAYRSRHARKLWEALIDPKSGIVAPGVSQPSVPYLAAHVHPTASSDRDALRWLPDFERTVAWTWISRQPPEAPELHAV